MRQSGAVLDLTAGAAVVLDGREWTVERREPHVGRVHLVGADGTRQWVTLRFLANHRDCWPSSRTAASGADRGRQPRMVKDLRPGWRELAELRMAHLGDPGKLWEGYAASPACSVLWVKPGYQRRKSVARSLLRTRVRTCNSR